MAAPFSRLPRLRGSSWLAAIALLAGCATGTSTLTGGRQEERVDLDTQGGPESIHISRDIYVATDTIGVAPDKAFTQLVRSYTTLGIPITGTDQTNHALTSGPFRAHHSFGGRRLSSWIDCGSTITGDMADQYEVTLKLTSAAEPYAGTQSIVKTNLLATAISTGSGTSTVTCTSRGQLEKRIAELARTP